MIKINIEYSIQKETERVINTISRIDSFIERGYNIRKLLFPKNLSYEELKLMTKDEIQKLITEEYIIDDYKKNIKYIQDRWLQIGPKLSAGIEKMKIVLIPEFDIIFTKYGITGSYHTPKTIIVNIQKFYLEGLLRSIIHESIHLVINPFILSYKIDHWSKERIVDLIFLVFFPELNKMQIIPNTDELDKIFYEYFPNIEEVILKISELKNTSNIKS